MNLDNEEISEKDNGDERDVCPDESGDTIYSMSSGLPPEQAKKMREAVSDSGEKVTLRHITSNERVKTIKTERQRRMNKRKKMARICLFCIDNFDLIAGFFDRFFMALAIIISIGFFYRSDTVRWVFILCSFLSLLISIILLGLKIKYGQGKITESLSKDSRVRETLENLGRTIVNG